MKTVVVYDSVQGNTKEIAEAIGKACGKETPVISAGSAVPKDLEGVELLIAGSPTYGGRPTQAMQAFLKSLSGTSLAGIKVAGFDTRIPANWVKLFGFASGKIEKSLKKLGGTPCGKPEGFFVASSKPPVLLKDELQRAGKWAKGLQE